MAEASSEKEVPTPQTAVRMPTPMILVGSKEDRDIIARFKAGYPEGKTVEPTTEDMEWLTTFFSGSNVRNDDPSTLVANAGIAAPANTAVRTAQAKANSAGA